MTTCYDPSHEPVPEDPARLTGPELGALVIHESKYSGPMTAVVVARSYVWSPEQHREDGYHGFRRYDWTVIERGKLGRVVVDDAELRPIEPGLPVAAPYSRPVPLDVAVRLPGAGRFRLTIADERPDLADDPTLCVYRDDAEAPIATVHLTAPPLRAWTLERYGQPSYCGACGSDHEPTCDEVPPECIVAILYTDDAQEGAPTP